jgi:xanthine dehydrogenase accessory factor
VPTDDRRILTDLAEATEARRPVALVTVVATRRSAPRRAGTKMLVHADGRRIGTVGGGAMEARVVAEAARALRDGRTRFLEYDLVDADRGDPGVCGGEISIYVEPYMPAPTVLVVGCGHVGAAVIDLAHWLGYRTVATDDRVELVTEEALPNADVLLPGSIGDVLDTFEITTDTSIVVVTRSADVDVRVIPRLLETPAAYIGVMGSRRRWQITRDQLLSSGVDETRLEQIHNPVGIDLGAETLEEIAVSILAEVIASNRRRVDPDESDVAPDDRGGS